MGEEQERRWRGGAKMESWDEMKREGERTREDMEEGRWRVGGGRRGRNEWVP